MNTASVTGALLPDDWPAWVPHAPVTEEFTLQRVITHMQRDALSEWAPTWHHDGSVSGNFFMASAGWNIEAISKPGADRLREAIAKHFKSRHYLLTVELWRIAEEQRLEEVVVRCSSHDRQRALAPIAAKYRPMWKPIEAELESIYRAGAIGIQQTILGL